VGVFLFPWILMNNLGRPLPPKLLGAIDQRTPSLYIRSVFLYAWGPHPFLCIFYVNLNYSNAEFWWQCCGMGAKVGKAQYVKTAQPFLNCTCAVPLCVL
jgi:hypothetical protein